MQQIERYGVIALLFVFVTIVVVSMWDDGADGEAAQTDLAQQPAPAQPKDDERTKPAAEQSRRPAPERVGEAVPRERERLPLSGSASEDRRAPALADARSARRAAPVPVEEDIARLTAPKPAPPGANGVANGVANDATNDTPQRTADEAARRAAGRRRGGMRRNTPTRVDPGSAASRDAASLLDTRRARTASGESVPVGQSAPPRARSVAAAAPPVESRPKQPRPASGTYRVKSGDTLEGIALAQLGDVKRWREIQSQNGGLNPLRLQVGMTLQMPAGATSKDAPSGGRKSRETSTEKLAGERFYTIRKGDMLSRIALRELGRASRWKELATLNPKIDPDRLMVGTRIRLPGGAVPAATDASRIVAQVTPEPRKTENRVR